MGPGHVHVHLSFGFGKRKQCKGEGWEQRDLRVLIGFMFTATSEEPSTGKLRLRRGSLFTRPPFLIFVRTLRPSSLSLPGRSCLGAGRARTDTGARGLGTEPGDSFLLSAWVERSSDVLSLLSVFSPRRVTACVSLPHLSCNQQ